jgi:hypothetical protein
MKWQVKGIEAFCWQADKIVELMKCQVDKIAS